MTTTAAAVASNPLTATTTDIDGEALSESLYMRAALLHLDYAHVETNDHGESGVEIDAIPSTDAETLELLTTYMSLWEQAQAKGTERIMDAGDTLMGTDAIGIEIPPERRDAVRTLLRAGYSFDEIGERFGITPLAVVHHSGFPCEMEDVPAFRAALAAIQADDIPTLSDLSERCGLGRDTLRRLCAVFGVVSHAERRRQDGGGRSNPGAVVERVRELHGIWPRQNKRILETVKAEFGAAASGLSYGWVNRLGHQLRGRGPRDNRPIG